MIARRIVNRSALAGRICRLRPYRSDDAAALCAVADNPMVARWMTRAFPSPYTRPDAERWLAHATSDTLAFGYWLGEMFWGRGIATARVLAART